MDGEPTDAEIAEARERVRALGYATARVQGGIRVYAPPGSVFDVELIRAACGTVPFQTRESGWAIAQNGGSE